MKTFSLLCVLFLLFLMIGCKPKEIEPVVAPPVIPVQEPKVVSPEPIVEVEPEPTEPQPTTPTTMPETTEKTTIIVSQVIDGDTIKIQTDKTVRLLGMNAPEMGQPYYEESTRRLKELIEGKTVTLEKDIEDKDQYGRLLRYIFLNNKNINVKLIREGLATVYIIHPNVKYEMELRQAENEAKNLEISIWTPPAPKRRKCVR